MLEHTWMKRRSLSKAKRSSSAERASASIVRSLRTRFSTVSIMPGTDARAPERTDTSGWFTSSLKTPAREPADGLQRRLDLSHEVVRVGPAMGVAAGANFGRDREARRHRQAEVGHLGAAAERANPLRHPIALGECQVRRALVPYHPGLVQTYAGLIQRGSSAS